MANIHTIIRRFILLCIFAALAIVHAIGTERMDTVMLSANHPVIYPVNSTRISRADSIWLADTLKMAIESLGNEYRILGRATASPEGPFFLNERLANGRMNTAKRILRQFGFDVERIQFEVVPEDYAMLLLIMQRNEDPAYELVSEYISRYQDDPDLLEKKLRGCEGGHLWRRMLRIYFPQLRTVHLMFVKESMPAIATATEEPATSSVEETPVGIRIEADTDSLSAFAQVEDSWVFFYGGLGLLRRGCR